MSPDLAAIFPEILIALGGLALLILPGIRSGRLLGMFTLALLLGALDLKLKALASVPLVVQPVFYGMLLPDRLSHFFQLVILGTMILVTLSLMGYAKEEVRCRREMYALLIWVTVGLMLVVGAQHFALVYVGLELVSLGSYLLTALAKKESLSVEGGLKYFLFGSLATGAFLYGISLVYGLTGAMDLPSLAQTFPAAMVRSPLVGTIALLLLTVGLGFKVAFVPFHMWAPDAYEGAPTPVTTFLSIGPKIAGFAVLARVFLLGLSPGVDLWPPLLVFLSILTMTVGNVVALVQTNVKRLLAYSSIAQAGTMAIGLAVATPMGLTAMLYYLVAYLLMNVGAFAGVIAVGNATGREDIGGFAGLSRTQPIMAAMITIAFLSLAGVPPMAGFFAKMWIFGSAIQAQAFGLAIAAGINSVIALFYYVKVIKTIYLDPAPAKGMSTASPFVLKLTLSLCTLGVLAVGLFPGPWLTLAVHALPFSLKSATLPWL